MTLQDIVDESAITGFPDKLPPLRLQRLLYGHNELQALPPLPMPSHRGHS